MTDNPNQGNQGAAGPGGVPANPDQWAAAPPSGVQTVVPTDRPDPFIAAFSPVGFDPTVGPPPEQVHDGPSRAPNWGAPQGAVRPPSAPRAIARGHWNWSAGAVFALLLLTVQGALLSWNTWDSLGILRVFGGTSSLRVSSVVFTGAALLLGLAVLLLTGDNRSAVAFPAFFGGMAGAVAQLWIPLSNWSLFVRGSAQTIAITLFEGAVFVILALCALRLERH